MKQFLKELKISSQKLMDKKEAEELVSYYEEIINDRLALGEALESILKDYDVSEILGEVISTKILVKPKDIFKTAFKVCILLFSTPLLIPLAIVYLVLLIVFGALIIAFVAAGFASLFQLLFYIIESLRFASSFPQTIGMISLGVLVTTVVVYISYLLSYSLYLGLNKLIKYVIDIAFKKRGHHENI